MQVPAAQRWRAVHAWPQAPQLAVSRWVFTHAPPQSVVPAAHAQTPAAQRVPPVQA